MANISAYQSALYEEAERLTGSKPLPVEVAEVCSTLGVAIRRSKIGGARALLVDAEGTQEILLAEGEWSSSRFTVWERFLVAHEVGHLILYRRGAPRAVCRSEYWKHDVLCDCFARRLLLPEKTVKALIGGSPRTGVRILDLSCRMARLARVPWPAAAHRISDRDPEVVFLRVSCDTAGRMRVTVSTFPNKKELHRRFAPSDPITAALRRVTTKMGIVELDLNALGGLISLSKVQTAAALRASEQEIRVAIVGQNAEQSATAGVEQAARESVQRRFAYPGP